MPPGGGARTSLGPLTADWRRNSAKPAHASTCCRNVFFDTCVYHQPGVDLLTRVIPLDNILFPMAER